MPGPAQSQELVEEETKMPYDFGGDYLPTESDYTQGFQQTNPQMSPGYGDSRSWIERLKEKLMRGGQAMQNVGAQNQMQNPMQQQGQGQGMQDPMASRSQSLSSSYSQGKQLGQAGRNIYNALGGG